MLGEADPGHSIAARIHQRFAHEVEQIGFALTMDQRMVDGAENAKSAVRFVQ